jgi:hypothetical protein
MVNTLIPKRSITLDLILAGALALTALASSGCEYVSGNSNIDKSFTRNNMSDPVGYYYNQAEQRRLEKQTEKISNYNKGKR